MPFRVNFFFGYWDSLNTYSIWKCSGRVLGWRYDAPLLLVFCHFEQFSFPSHIKFKYHFCIKHSFQWNTSVLNITLNSTMKKCVTIMGNAHTKRIMHVNSLTHAWYVKSSFTLATSYKNSVHMESGNCYLLVYLLEVLFLLILQLPAILNE